MTTNNDTQQLAEGALKMAVMRIAQRYPFHVAILERFKIVPRPGVGTMGVTISGENVLLLYDPEFVLGTSADELAGVLLHEVHHVLFRHMLADPADHPDQWARTVAEEVTANEFITEPLPSDGITLRQYPSLRPMQSTDERYRKLVKRVRRAPISRPGTQSNGNQGHGETGHHDNDGETGHHNNTDSEDRKAKKAGKENNRGDRAGNQRGGGHGTLDDHSVWEEFAKDPTQSEATIRSVVQEAVLEVGRDNIPEELAGAVGDMGIGTAPGAGQHHLHGGYRGRVDWRRLLRRHVGQLQTRPVFNRPSRRFPELVGIVPGKRRRSGKPKIMAVIDTSASITADTVELIDGELARLARHHTVLVAQCDAAIHTVQLYQRLTVVHGRGGTDLRPPFEADFLRKHRPDLIVYFTDGHGPAPVRPPRLPVVWCLVSGGRSPAEWGKKIHMEGQGPTG